MKIQRKNIGDMTDAEKVAVEYLLIPQVECVAPASYGGSDDNGGILGNIRNEEKEELSNAFTKYGSIN